jgi:hypothetical protein
MVAAKGLLERAFVSLEKLPYAGLHGFLFDCS